MTFLYSFSPIQSDSEEYQAACKLWQVYLQTRAEFVQPGDGDDDDEDGDDMMENPGMSTEDEVSYIACLYITYVLYVWHCYKFSFYWMNEFPMFLNGWGVLY